MNKLDLEESKRFFNHRYQTEKDRDIKNFIGQLESLVEEINFESHMDFRRSFEERVHDFKKKNDKYPTIHFDQNILKNSQVEEINYVPKKQSLEKPVFENYEKIIPNGSKSICVVINTFDQLIDAIKCVLWSLENEPSTAIKIFQHILIMKDNKEVSFTKEDYENYTNDLISKATRNGQLYVQKDVIKGKTIWFYTNPTKKRLGYFLDGKLRTLRQIEKFYDIPRATLHNRLKKMSIDQAVKK
jgi:hypothetical protein